jgi:hypothetical protein
MRWTALLLVAVACTAACTKPNPEYCDLTRPCTTGTCDLTTHRCEGTNPDGGGASDAAIACGTDAAACPGADPVCTTGFCTGCTTTADCTSPAFPICPTAGGRCAGCTSEGQCTDKGGPPHCDTSSGACVECRDSNDCSGNTPFCGAGNVCRACEADTECPAGNECDDVSGTCVADANVIFVDATGTATSGCNVGGPCAKLGDGLSEVTSGRTLVHVATGTYMESLTINQSMTIVGRGNPSWTAKTVGAPVVTITGGTVAVAGMDISMAIGTVSTQTPDGVSCSAASANLTLERDTIEGNGRYGVSSLAGCQLTLDRSIVRNNGVAGLSIDSTAAFTVVNDIINGNGTATTTLGGVHILQAPVGSILAFDTISANHATSGAAGVSCTLGGQGDSDIIYGNTGGNAVDTTCTWTHSVIDQSGLGAGNSNQDCGLTSDFHLTASSPCLDQANPLATVTVDIDGDTRPARGGFDPGADEVP